MSKKWNEIPGRNENSINWNEVETKYNRDSKETAKPKLLMLRKTERERPGKAIIIYGDSGVGKTTFTYGFQTSKNEKTVFTFDLHRRNYSVSGWKINGAVVPEVDVDQDFEGWGMNPELSPANRYENFLKQIESLWDSEYKTIIFDGISVIAELIWSILDQQMIAEIRKEGVLGAQNLTYGKGHNQAKALYDRFVKAAMFLARIKGKTLIFIDHLKIGSEDINTEIAKIKIKKIHPLCCTNFQSLLIREVDCIYPIERAYETNVQVSKNRKNGPVYLEDIGGKYNGPILLTDPDSNLDYTIKNDFFGIRDRILPTYKDFMKAIKESFDTYRVNPKKVTKEEAAAEEAIEDSDYEEIEEQEVMVDSIENERLESGVKNVQN